MDKINTLEPSHNLFKQRLQAIADPPKKLYYRGNLYAYDAPAIAIVGTRKPTIYGQEITYKLAYDLAAQGVIIISGLALGVDSIAHRAALDAGGITAAVLPGGIDTIYPYRHRKLAEDIITKGGALFSEYEAKTPALRHQFIARNRIVAALGNGVLVTEAASKSGTLHTANFALDIGRSVMAVPGAITNPMASGTNRLIQSGAALVTCSDDVLFSLGITSTKAQQMTLIAETKEEEILINLLQQGISNGEEMQIQSGLTASEFNQTLSMLEITGKIRPLGSNQWSLR